MSQPVQQLKLFDIEVSKPFVFTAAAGTFANNHSQDVHRWFPYIEGYSYDLVAGILDSLPDRPTFVYDPFGGSGTTMLVASERQIVSGYSEINPFMRFVTECKVNVTKCLVDDIATFNRTLHEMESFIDYLQRDVFSHECAEIALEGFTSVFGDRKYFDEVMLRQVLTVKNNLSNYETPARELLLLGLASVLVQVSNLIRRADLRYRRKDELQDRPSDLRPVLVKKVRGIVFDILQRRGMKLASTELNGADARVCSDAFRERADVIITSPPYLNGTNYFRNTKLELWLYDQLHSEDDLKAYRTSAIAAGINNVSSRNRPSTRIAEVETYAMHLDERAYDDRIPKLIRAYFSDMQQVFSAMRDALQPGGRVFLDIGDSIFAGVHIPTHDLLVTVGQAVGLDFVAQHTLRTRHSNGGAKLTQVLLEFTKPQATHIIRIPTITQGTISISDLARSFAQELPFQKPPYNKRNWGHPLHSLCSYQGKMKPSLAYFLVANFTKPGDVVLDPLAGVGTIPFEACLQGRVGIANDISSVAYANCLAKVKRTNVGEVKQVIRELESYMIGNLPSIDEVKAIRLEINGPIQAYYDVLTLREIVAARRFFQEHRVQTAAQAIVFASLLHILHGNRPYALSRHSHPITPLSPTGRFEYRALIPRLTEKAIKSAEIPHPESFREGNALFGDYESLASTDMRADAIITSPPFFGSTRFYLANWLRLWFSGWEQEDFAQQRIEYLETQQQKNMDVYQTFFRMCESVLKPKGTLVIHLGKSKRCDMAHELVQRLPTRLELLYQFDEDVSVMEKHGLSDKGSTHTHQFLFIRRN